MTRISTILPAAIFLSFLFSAPAHAASNIVFISDFGLKNDSVAQCKAVIYGISPETRVTDMTHGIEPYDILFASFLLSDSASLWPRGTVFLSVIDPGAGTSRKRIAMKTCLLYTSDAADE